MRRFADVLRAMTGRASVRNRERRSRNRTVIPAKCFQAAPVSDYLGPNANATAAAETRQYKQAVWSSSGRPDSTRDALVSSLPRITVRPTA